LRLEQLPAWEGNDPDINAFRRQPGCCLEDQIYLRTGGHQDQLGIFVADIREDIRTFEQAVRISEDIPVNGRQVLA
jgi:hypothetical protein